MKPLRTKIANQIVLLVMPSRKAWKSPAWFKLTGPICVIPRFSSESPVVAHTIITKTITSVFKRSFRSWDIFYWLVVAGGRRCRRNGDQGLFAVAALACPLQTFGAQFQKFRRFVVQAFALVTIPQRFFHDAPYDLGTEIIFIVETVYAGHHFRFRKVRVLNMRQLVSGIVRQRFYLQETFLGHGII